MHTSLFDTIFADSFFSPIRTINVTSELPEIKIRRHQEELDKLQVFRKRLKEIYQSLTKIINERNHELKEEVKSLEPAEKQAKKCAING